MKKVLVIIFTALLIVMITVGLAISLRSDGETSSIFPVYPNNSGNSSAGEQNNNSLNDNSNSDSEQSQPEQSIPEEKKVIKFVAAGDNIMHTSILNDATEKAQNGAKYNFDHIYEDIIPYIKTKDIAYVNVETLIGGPSRPVAGYPNFNSPDEIGEYLIDMGFNVMNMAHNHMLDSGNSDFLKYCDNFFKSRGMAVLGYYKDTADTENIVIVEEQGIKIAFLTYTYGTNGHILPASDPTYIPYINDALIKKQVALAKEQADLVFVSMHWGDEDNWYGTNNVYPVSDEQKRVAKLLADEGVDAVIGMHPHVLQTCEWLERKDGGKMFVVYSIGNLISGMYWGRNMVGGLLEFDIISENGEIYIDSPKIIPIVNHYKRISGEVFRDFKIYFFEDYTDELAAAHGCHAKDDALVSAATGREKFSIEAINKRIINTYDKEFLPEYYQ